VLEAGFLILLAVGVGIADLSPALIILVMAIAWVLVALIEYFAWRQGPRFASVSRYAAEAEPAPVAVHEEVVEEMPPPPPPAPAPAPPPAAEEETIVQPAAEPAAEPSPDEPIPDEFLAEPERRMRHRLEPLQPRPRRRWVVFGPRERPEAQAEGDREEER
jgi:hypothetical protein